MSTAPTTDLHAWRGDFAHVARMKILVIDDEPENVAVLAALLNDTGFSRVQTLTDSARALETCRSFEPDLVLLDLQMPEPDGFAVLKSLRADGSELFLPVVVLTGDTTHETKRRVLAAGATDYLAKPFDFLEVLLRISNLLETRRVHLQLDNQRAAFEEAVRQRTAELRQLQFELEQAQSLAAS